ncbi:DUF1903-domain-containing protein [Sodiomyces alkalinus F11]|uniref:Cx9C motif-containing protein 4, mitochondrial n=1 Tax=Sodiomyces alkalinus (strain CBS 110278 / VKM F-3762 / F11) TaxID=1314773 RepID=A0A3N2Q011_SODAK|nr:DUF1903-domain-containing protein [Sodiomyces alkalinus F11]ROT40110.1 DUF1903-domain-containing protein [Sodiomyces alkalinus F11]
MTVKPDRQENLPCHPEACKIQKCLSQNNYDETKCQSAVLALYQCCGAFYAHQGNTAATPSCPKPDLVRLKLNQIKTETDKKSTA